MTPFIRTAPRTGLTFAHIALCCISAVEPRYMRLRFSAARLCPRDWDPLGRRRLFSRFSSCLCRSLGVTAWAKRLSSNKPHFTTPLSVCVHLGSPVCSPPSFQRLQLVCFAAHLVWPCAGP
jgi:hypothetical protein